MRHHQYQPNFKFYKDPIEFTKDTEKETLKYCLGAMLYMPAHKDFLHAILSQKYPGLTTMAMCFEDACKEEDVPIAQENAYKVLDAIADAKDAGTISDEILPLIFFRVRNQEQFRAFAGQLNKRQMSVFSGFIFPKFNSGRGEEYFYELKILSEKFGRLIYGMPILESRDIVQYETRHDELSKVHYLIEKYKDFVLNVRVGATDFSSTFGVRRGIDYTIYDILTVQAAISAILNIFSRDNSYVISGPVWEYFQMSHENKFEPIDESKLQHSLLSREPLVNSAIDGLLREVLLDRANGFIGKTVIHPSHLRYVNAMQAVTKEEFEDACQVLATSGGVIKSAKANKMNEIRPHTNWAIKVAKRAEVYGVIEDESDYAKLFREN
ncbi:MAG: HpcH/HpaI aldolase/citrate lyase family protein [Lachnospiraceae bacterium]|jgi:citrate lyase beta subunit|nr:HpcH/HpaI aldolase/citrate lyase family protein [Lachnospiraceae bacterium]